MRKQFASVPNHQGAVRRGGCPYRTTKGRRPFRRSGAGNRPVQCKLFGGIVASRNARNLRLTLAEGPPYVS